MNPRMSGSAKKKPSLSQSFQLPTREEATLEEATLNPPAQEPVLDNVIVLDNNISTFPQRDVEIVLDQQGELAFITPPKGSPPAYSAALKRKRAVDENPAVKRQVFTAKIKKLMLINT